MSGANRVRTWLAVVVVTVAAAGGWFAIRVRGDHLLPPPSFAEATSSPSSMGLSVLAHLLLALGVIMVVARALGRLLERTLGQPPVIGEIAAGLLLGPSALGAVWPDAYAALLPAAMSPHLGMVANLGAVLFMFVVGLEFDPRLLRGTAHAVVAVSHAGIAVPFVLGSALALWTWPLYGSGAASFTAFSLFAGVAMAVTAFPVLARILRDRGLHRTPLGATALACAAVGDVTAWVLLALVVAVAHTEPAAALRIIPFAALYVAVMMLLVRPWVRRFAARQDESPEPPSRSALAVVLAAALASATATEAIGLHALFGAFGFGAVMPHEGRLAEAVRARIEDMVVVLFLPAFFAYTGMRTEIGLLETARDWAFCGLVIAIATVGKVGGGLVAARLSGQPWRESAALGVLMNTRGLMELVVLNVGLDLGVITPPLFAMYVLMALVTTFSTTPLLTWLGGVRAFDEARPVP